MRLGPRLRIFAGLVLTSMLALSFAAASAQAAEEGAVGGTATEIFKWINFAIWAGVIAWVFAKLLPPVFRRNAEKIGAEIARASAAKAEAERRLREAEDKLAKLEREVAELRETARRETEAEAVRIRKLAESDAERIAAAVVAELEAAGRAARLELKAAAAKLAVDEAKLQLARDLTPRTQEELVAGFVKSLAGRPN